MPHTQILKSNRTKKKKKKIDTIQSPLLFLNCGAEWKDISQNVMMPQWSWPLVIILLHICFKYNQCMDHGIITKNCVTLKLISSSLGPKISHPQRRDVISQQLDPWPLFIQVNICTKSKRKFVDVFLLCSHDIWTDGQPNLKHNASHHRYCWCRNMYEIEMQQTISTQSVFEKKLPSIWEWGCRSRDTHTSACSLPQHPCALPSKHPVIPSYTQIYSAINYEVLASIATVINHLAYSIKVSRKPSLIKWTSRSKCKWPFVERVAGWVDFQPEVFGGWFGRRAFI